MEGGAHTESVKPIGGFSSRFPVAPNASVRSGIYPSSPFTSHVCVASFIVFVCLSSCLSLFISVTERPCLCPLLCQSIPALILFLLSVHRSGPFIHPFVHRSVHPSVFPSFCPSDEQND